MNSFNLLKEPWIVVMTDELGTTKEVSLVDLFQNAHLYKRLAGETHAQDFAILRFLLAIMYTVFTRFDSSGKVYEYLELDEKMIPKSDIDSDDEEDYLDELYSTWKGLWKSKEFPEIINKYLEKWSSRFNLFDDKYPFYQVTAEDLKTKNVVKTGEVKFKFINRLISESNNKVELFSPLSEKHKNEISNSEFTRWLISFQGYTGTADKAKLPEMKASASKGWLLGLGSVYLKGENLKQTLLLNLIMDVEHESMQQFQFFKKQTPIWEKSFDDAVDDLLNKTPNNLAELYTNHSRLIMSKENIKDSDSFEVVQLPKLNDENFLLEPMTIWKKDKKKNISTPRAHYINQSFWRSFGNVVLSNDDNSSPSIIAWHRKITYDDLIKEKQINVVAVGLDYNRDASTMVNNTIYDELNINNYVLADIDEDGNKKTGWVIRIVEQIELTKKVITFSIRNFANDIVKIRNLVDKTEFVNEIVKAVYFDIDLPFRKWLSEIEINDDKDKKIIEWKKELETIILAHGDNLLKNASNRDFLGKVIKIGNKDEGTYMNIQIAYNNFVRRLRNNLYENNL